MAVSIGVARAQDLVPGAYTPAPSGVSIVTISSVYSKGDIAFDPSLPIDDARAKISWAAVGVARTLNAGGRFASVAVGLPLVFGHIQGQVLDTFQETSRSGLGDLSVRAAVNLHGAPAMTLKQFAGYRPTTIVGISLGIVAPVGQYNPARAINLGTNRWAFKPELGVSRTRGKWTAEADLGMVFFADNTNYLNGRTRTQAPIASFQGHIIRAVRPGFWVAADGNFWKGGSATTDGGRPTREQRNSRLGVTVAVPVHRQQIRVAYSLGAYTTTGGDFHSVGVSYSYAWTGRP